jgi:hypothetical protein
MSVIGLLKNLIFFFGMFLLFVVGFFYWIDAQTFSSYLFAYFTGNSGSEEAVRFAISDNGFEYQALNNNEPVLSSQVISSTGGIRDPHILRGADGKTFYMVMTDMKAANGWESNHGMILLKSSNLVDWTYSQVDIHTAFPEFDTVNHVWAPQTIYDGDKKKYIVYWSMRSGSEPNAIYYSYANDDFTKLETVPKVLFSAGSVGVIDGDIIEKNGIYHMFFKYESGSVIRQALSSNLTGGYKIENDSNLQPSGQQAEGPCVFKLIDSNIYVLIYDLYNAGKYGFSESEDLINFKVTSRRVSYDFTPRHGTVMTITAEERETVVKKWGIS